MSGISRDEHRTKVTAEFFTPTEVVIDRLDELDPKVFADPNQTFIDPAGCGDGQFLGEILIRKLQNGINFETALSRIYGVDIMPDNIKLCKERLLCGREDLRHIVNKNLVCADSLRYHFRFDGSFPYDEEFKEKQFNDRFQNLFDCD